HFQAEWSPDSKKVFTQILDLRRARKMYLLESVNDGFRSRLFSYYRASPGDVNVPYLIPVIFDIQTLREVRVDMDPVPHFLGLRAEWSKDGKTLVALKFDRGYKAVNLLEIDAESGKVRTVVRDENPTCVETGLVRYKVFPSSGQAFLTSERDGWNHIYRFDWATGKLLNQVTRGEFVVLNILDADEKAQTITFSAVGKEKGEDPYLVHLYRVGFDGSGLKPLTLESAFHDISVSPDKTCFVDNISRVDLPTVSLLRGFEDGAVLMELEKADIQDILAEGWTFPEPFRVKAADGKTDVYGLIWRPSGFDPSKKYPIIDQTYTGPQAVATPKTFRRALMNANTALAELGFVCVTVDGRGTARRSKAFHDFSYRNLGGGCLDHVAAIRALAKKFPYMDITRVGIYGHSAGGYDTVRAMLEWPDVYKVGVSSSGNHDHRMAKAWWPEQYMGWPVGDFYEKQSNITNAGKLKGKLLLVHGELDENVNPVATFRLVDALIKHNKDFDLLILPGNHHGYRGVYGDYFTRKRWDFFVRHLHGQEPPAYRITPEKED
ncbi:MAG: prolyl oligopeptidase family serine peptidase, partial [Candidatus Aminicenantales bacterium]